MWLFSAFISLLATNLVFTHALGTSTLLAATKNRSHLTVLALLMTVFSTLACLMTGILVQLFRLEKLLHYPYSLGLPLLFTLVISVIYILVLLVLFLAFRSRFPATKKYVHLSAFNCAVMGTLYLAFAPVQFLQNVRTPSDIYVFGHIYLDTVSPFGAAVFGLQSGLGFVLAALMLSAVRERLYDKSVPAAFRGFPAVMVFLGLISMAVYAISMEG